MNTKVAYIVYGENRGEDPLLLEGFFLEENAVEFLMDRRSDNMGYFSSYSMQEVDMDMEQSESSKLNQIRELASHLGKESEFLCGKDDRPEDYRIGRVYHEIQTQILKLLDQ